MNINILKNIIVEGQELLNRLDICPRNFDFEANARYVFVGVRQAGKSYLLYHRAKQLIEAGHDIKEMLFVNFDDERLIGMTADNLDLILQAYSSLFDLTPILFLDEIQNVEGWEHFARRLANQKYQVYITGSNAKMLSHEIASILGARYIEQRVFPYSFAEYLDASGIAINNSWEYGNKRGEVLRALDSYFTWGGFPELLLYTNKRLWLNELYEKIILSDIILRNGIKNEMAIRLSLKRLAENIKNPTSYNRLANMVKATGVSTNVASVMNYIQFCKEACVIFTLDNYASKFVEKETIKKHYFVDNGILNIFLTDSETALFENICALTLYRASISDPDNEVFYYNKESEIDFYIPSREHAIQACYNLDNPDTEEREVKALTLFHRLYGLKRADIVTYSEDRIIHTPDLDINVIPLARWLLNQNS